MNNIAAGIVTYNPLIERLNKNIMAIISQVDKIYIFDNGSKNIDDIESIFDNEKIEYIKANNNLGIAYALNRLFEQAKKDNFEWLLTLDQDSVSFPNIIANYEKFLDEADSLTSLRKDKYFYGNFIDDYKVRNVDYCITSGNLVKIKSWELVGGFNERLFIDMVDIDFCFRMREIGLQIKKINFWGIEHEMGDGSYISLFGKRIFTGNYNSFRKYYISRNMVYVIRKYRLKRHYYSYKRIAILLFATLLRETNKIEKCKSIIHGFIDGFRKFDYIDQYNK